MNLNPDQRDLFGDHLAGVVCSCCGRPLSNPDSVAAGIGPVCGGRVGRQDQADLFNAAVPEFADQLIAEPIRPAFIFRRIEGRPATNVPHRAALHSPNGYEWGYGGSGPADLALNILEAARLALGIAADELAPCWWGKVSDLAIDGHQEFKWRYIAPLPFEGGVIELATVEAFIRELTGSDPDRGTGSGVL